MAVECFCTDRVTLSPVFSKRLALDGAAKHNSVEASQKEGGEVEGPDHLGVLLQELHAVGALVVDVDQLAGQKAEEEDQS